MNSAANLTISAGSAASPTGSFTSAGSGGISITATSGDLIGLGSMTANTSLTAPILLKATGSVTVAASKTVTSAGGPITFWTRSAALNSASTQGYVLIGNSTIVTSNGGAITLAGSSSTDATTGLPNGYALSSTTSRGGVQLGTSAVGNGTTAQLVSGGGAIQVRGKATVDSSWGVALYPGVNINSGAGRILIDGWATGTLDGVAIDSTATAKSTITSSAVADAVTPAISITGDCDSTSTATTEQRGIWGGTSGLTISATGGGDILLTGTNSATHSTNPGAIYIQSADIVASTGYVKLDGGTQGVVTSISGGTTNLGATSAGSATGAVTVIGDRIISAGTTTIKTSGAVVEESSSASFAAAFNASTLNVTAGAGSLRIGKSGNTSDVTVSAGTISVLGNITINGAAITQNASMTTTVDGNISMVGSGAYSGSGALNAKGYVSVTGTSFSTTGAITSSAADGITISASSGGATIGANLNAGTATASVSITASGSVSGAGTITATRNVNISSGSYTGTGAITASGSGGITLAATSGVATLGGNLTTDTNGGNVSVTASGAVSGAATITSAGAVSITGSSFSGTGAISSVSNGGIYITATGGDATVGGNLNAQTSTSAPIVVKATANISVTASKTINTNGGGVVLWSRSGAAESSTTVGAISLGNSSQIVTKGGRITLAGSNTNLVNGIPTGHAYTTTASTGGVQLGTSDLATDTNIVLNSSGGPIELYGQQAGDTNSWGVMVRGGTKITSGTGTISIDGKSNSATTGNAIAY